MKINFIGETFPLFDKAIYVLQNKAIKKIGHVIQFSVNLAQKFAGETWCSERNLVGVCKQCSHVAQKRWFSLLFQLNLKQSV